VSSGPLSPALVSALEHHGEISKWLQASPTHVAEFRADPIAAIAKHFPKVDLKSATPPIDLSALSLAGLLRQFPADQATFEFFSEVWAFVAASQANMEAFESDRAGTIARLGAGKPDYVVTLVTEALTASSAGGGPQEFAALAALLHEMIRKQVIDPSGPVQARVSGELGEFILPPSEMPGGGQ
jgi:hypothetical protein